MLIKQESQIETPERGFESAEFTYEYDEKDWTVRLDKKFKNLPKL